MKRVKRGGGVSTVISPLHAQARERGQKVVRKRNERKFACTRARGDERKEERRAIQ